MALEVGQVERRGGRKVTLPVENACLQKKLIEICWVFKWFSRNVSIALWGLFSFQIPRSRRQGAQIKHGQVTIGIKDFPRHDNNIPATRM